MLSLCLDALQAINVLLAARAKVDAIDRMYGQVALHRAAEGGHAAAVMLTHVMPAVNRLPHQL